MFFRYRLVTNYRSAIRAELAWSWNVSGLTSSPWVHITYSEIQLYKNTFQKTLNKLCTLYEQKTTQKDNIIAFIIVSCILHKQLNVICDVVEWGINFWLLFLYVARKHQNCVCVYIILCIYIYFFKFVNYYFM